MECGYELDRQEQRLALFIRFMMCARILLPIKENKIYFVIIQTYGGNIKCGQIKCMQRFAFFIKIMNLPTTPDLILTQLGENYQHLPCCVQTLRTGFFIKFIRLGTAFKKEFLYIGRR
jgi:hypothetical protein